MEPQDLTLFFEPKDRLRLTIKDEKSYITVKPVWAAPLSRPEHYLSLLDGKGDEIVLIENPNKLPSDSLKAVKQELRQRYLTAVIKSIEHAKQEFGATYWNVDTDRGKRDFVTQNLQENAIWLSGEHLLLLDVDGNRFEIPDITLLDNASQNYIDSIL